jgi:hypothetical protein
MGLQQRAVARVVALAELVVLEVVVVMTVAQMILSA